VITTRPERRVPIDRVARFPPVVVDMGRMRDPPVLVFSCSCTTGIDRSLALERPLYVALFDAHVRERERERGSIRRRLLRSASERHDEDDVRFHAMALARPAAHRGLVPRMERVIRCTEVAGTERVRAERIQSATRPSGASTMHLPPSRDGARDAKRSRFRE
jgi:hypothetical protein